MLFLKVRYMSNYVERINFQTQFPSLENGVFIICLHVDKGPPHVGLMVDGRYFSLKVLTSDFDVMFSSVETVVLRKCIPTIIVEIQPSISLDQVKSVFSTYGSTILPNDSCMTPLLGMLRMPQTYLLDDVLMALEQSGQIKHVYGMFLPTTFDGIPSYTNEDVQNRINSLRNVNR